MPERLIVVGGEAAGISVASQARRRWPLHDQEILVFERSSLVSYSACSEPYYMGGYETDMRQLQAQILEELAATGISVQTHHKILALDPKAGVDHRP